MNDKTTIRGSYGIYDMIILGSVFFSLTGTVQSDVRFFNNVGTLPLKLMSKCTHRQRPCEECRCEGD